MHSSTPPPARPTLIQECEQPSVELCVEMRDASLQTLLGAFAADVLFRRAACGREEEETQREYLTQQILDLAKGKGKPEEKILAHLLRPEGEERGGGGGSGEGRKTFFVAFGRDASEGKACGRRLEACFQSVRERVLKEKGSWTA